jgi:hypothetical protein
MSVNLDPKKIKDIGEIAPSLAFNTGKPVVLDFSDRQQMESAIRKATEQRPELCKDYIDALDRLVRK